MGASVADILSRFSLTIKSKNRSSCSCAELRIDPKFYRIANLDVQTWKPAAISPDSPCSLCQAIKWMFQNTPGNATMSNADARGVNLLFQSRPRLDRLTFDFSSVGSYPPIKHCPYSLVPLCEGTHARLIEGTSFNPEMVKGWLDECDSAHSCVDEMKARDTRFELRLIDVLDMCVVMAPEVCRYSALSYVWGDIRQPLLQSSNYNQLVTKESLSQLPIPQTIKDAMQVCRLLDIRYLWVDSLCIIQDSNDHTAGQIAHMHNIYREAYLTIVVAAGSDCASGIPSIQPRPPFPPAVTIDQFQFAVVPHLFDAVEFRVQTSTWNQRCWTMQESALSRRRLVFSSHEYYLSCDKGIYTEALVGKMLQPHRSAIPPLPDFPHGKTLTAQDRRRADLSYLRIVSLYVSKKLTYPGDILRAFEGMANALTPFLGPFQWGIPHRLFRFALCWSNFAQLRRRPGFPSWSWTGWQHPHIQRRGTMSNTILSTWPFHFPGFDVTELYPHCSVHLWDTPTSTHPFTHTYPGHKPDWPAKPSLTGTLKPHIDAFLAWADEDTPACITSFPHVVATVSSLAHIISFCSSIATFENTWFPTTSTAETHRSYVQDIGVLEPRFHASASNGREHQVASHVEAGSGRVANDRLTLVWLGQLEGYVVVLPIVVDAEVAEGKVWEVESGGDEVRHVLVRREGNPFKMFNDVWYMRARRCVVHSW